MLNFTNYVVYSRLLSDECYDMEFDTLKEAKKEFDKQRKNPEIKEVTLCIKDKLNKEYTIETHGKSIWVVIVTFNSNVDHFYRTTFYDKAYDYFTQCQSDVVVKKLRLYHETFDGARIRCEMWTNDFVDY